MKQTIHTAAAPAAIGPYSQAVRLGNLVFLPGQIPLVPETMEMVQGDMDAQIRQVLDNLSAVCVAAGGRLDDIVKLNVFLVDLAHFPRVNQAMDPRCFHAPFPARAAIGVAALPRGAAVEMDAILAVHEDH